jgi:hypothetical protein
MISENAKSLISMEKKVRQKGNGSLTKSLSSSLWRSVSQDGPWLEEQG